MQYTETDEDGSTIALVTRDPAPEARPEGMGAPKPAGLPEWGDAAEVLTAAEATPANDVQPTPQAESTTGAEQVARGAQNDTAEPIHETLLATEAEPAHEAEPALEAEPAVSPWIDRVIDDRYRILELLAEGGMGTVFIAEHLRLRKMVALKTIHPSFLGNEEVAARFAREAMASAQLEHPHVASAMDYGSLPEGGTYLVLELVRGPSLRAQIQRQGATSWNQACEVAAQIADALCAAHAMGIVHRDLKPENVLLEARHGGSPIVKVLDFGIAGVREGAPSSLEATRPTRALTRVGAVMGTPGYMAPEQAAGDPVDERADLYALGVILWEMLAGHCLFEAPNLTGILTQQFGSPASVRLAQASVSVPPELVQLLDGLLAPVPMDRLNSAVQVRDALRALASRDATQGTSQYRVDVPTAVSRAAPKLRGAFQTLLHRASLQCAALLTRANGARRRMTPHLRVVWAKAWVLLHALWAKTSHALRTAAPRVLELLVKARSLLLPAGRGVVAMLRACGRRVGAWLAPLPRHVVWGGAGGILIVLISVIVVASEIAGSEDKPASLASSEADVQSRIDVLSQSRSLDERRAAARWLRRAPAEAEVPAFARALARLELGPDCKARTAALRRLRALDDPRSLPAITIWNDKPRQGCGASDKLDCYACLRSELRATQRALQDGDGRTAAR